MSRALSSWLRLRGSGPGKKSCLLQFRDGGLELSVDFENKTYVVRCQHLKPANTSFEMENVPITPRNRVMNSCVAIRTLRPFLTYIDCAYDYVGCRGPSSLRTTRQPPPPQENGQPSLVGGTDPPVLLLLGGFCGVGCGIFQKMLRAFLGSLDDNNMLGIDGDM